MIHHETAILDDFDSGFREWFGRGIVPNSGLQPYCLRHLRQNIFNVGRDVLRTAEDVHEIDIDRNVNEPPVDLLLEYARHVWIVDRYRNDLKAGSLEITWNIVCWFACLGLGLNAEHGDGARLAQQVRDFRRVCKYVLLPIHELSILGSFARFEPRLSL